MKARKHTMFFSLIGGRGEKYVHKVIVYRYGHEDSKFLSPPNDTIPMKAKTRVADS